MRIGDRVVSLGEAPYLDSASVGRKEGLERREKRNGKEEKELVIREKQETPTAELK